MGFYSLSPLTPGGWLSLLDEAGLPHAMRRLPLLVEAGGERAVEARCLNMLPALAYLLAQPHDREESASVRAWRLASRLVPWLARRRIQPRNPLPMQRLRRPIHRATSRRRRTNQTSAADDARGKGGDPDRLSVVVLRIRCASATPRGAPAGPPGALSLEQGITRCVLAVLELPVAATWRPRVAA